jgi:hypothetical protein
VQKLVDVKPPELVETPDGRRGIKVYLCERCKTTLQAKERAHGGRLRTIDVDWLCASCRQQAGRR